MVHVISYLSRWSFIAFAAAPLLCLSSAPTASCTRCRATGSSTAALTMGETLGQMCWWWWWIGIGDDDEEEERWTKMIMKCQPMTMTLWLQQIQLTAGQLYFKFLKLPKQCATWAKLIHDLSIGPVVCLVAQVLATKRESMANRHPTEIFPVGLWWDWIHITYDIYIYTVYWIYMSYFQHITQPSLIIHLVEVIHLEDHVRPEVWRNSPPVICDDLMYFYMMVWDDPTIS